MKKQVLVPVVPADPKVFHMYEWSTADVLAVQEALDKLPGSIRTKLENLVLDLVCPNADTDPAPDSDGDFLYHLVQLTN